MIKLNLDPNRVRLPIVEDVTDGVETRTELREEAWATLHELACLLEEQWGDGWKVSDDRSTDIRARSAVCRGEMQVELSMLYHYRPRRQHPGRIIVRGHLGKYWQSVSSLADVKRCKITISETKDPDQIVSEIRRRLLYTYEEIFTNAKNQYDKLSGRGTV